MLALVSGIRGLCASLRVFRGEVTVVRIGQGCGDGFYEIRCLVQNIPEEYPQIIHGVFVADFIAKFSDFQEIIG